MAKNDKPAGTDTRGHSKVKLALGAAGLFLFIIGVKRTFREPADVTARNDEDGTMATGKPGGKTQS
jgi:hypothetical protein